MTNPREFFKHYIGVSESDEKQMLDFLGHQSLNDLYEHIGSSNYMQEMKLPLGVSREELKKDLENLASKNKKTLSFLGDGLQDFVVPNIVPRVCSIRGLTTAYTPYQPERSQGTLQTLWIYQSVISALTGFEAINASLYERSTCLFEAIHCALRLKKNKNTVIVASNIYPGDIEVLETMREHTELNIIYAPINPETSLIDQTKLKTLINDNKENLAALCFPQLNSFGQIEHFNDLTDIATQNDLASIGIFEPMALANNGLKEPALWGSNAQGVDIIVGEGQHLTLNPNYGGPGLGIFGIRYNDSNKNSIRSTAGRYIGKSVDEFGQTCKSIILSTREQHIRREKATSNICSNQSFVASACGAAMLVRGDEGINDAYNKAHDNAVEMANFFMGLEGASLKYTNNFFNELTLKLNCKTNDLIKKASDAGIHIGVNINNRCNVEEDLLLVSLSDRHTKKDLETLKDFFKANFKYSQTSTKAFVNCAPQSRSTKAGIPKYSEEEIFNYYTKLGDQNLSPDDGLYPLGSCTMKYNPEINDWAAGLSGFTATHPQAPQEDVQGNLELLYNIQEWFKQITGLPALTTQPVAGAQGELVGLKMFQAYHKNNGEELTRNIIIIPRSAHGTNPATATVAGFQTKRINGVEHGIVTLPALSSGEMDFEALKETVEKFNTRICAIMVTNPNTAGIFETKFKQMSELIHSVGGLVYMDGANMNAIAGWIDLDKLGVDAVHNNLHKTWSIPHGGGGPGDAIVAVSSKLIDFLPGFQVVKSDKGFEFSRPSKSIGSFHRHHGNFAHKVRAYTYLAALGRDGIKRMSGIAVLSAVYLYKKLVNDFPILPKGSIDTPRMHEFILTISDETFDLLAKNGTPKANAIARIGKLFLDFGFHAPTVAFPEQYGLMLEPTESFTKEELDKFADMVKSILNLVKNQPQILTTVPHFTPVAKVDELAANKTPIMRDIEIQLDPILEDKISAAKLRNLDLDKVQSEILSAHNSRL